MTKYKKPWEMSAKELSQRAADAQPTEADQDPQTDDEWVERDAEDGYFDDNDD